MKNPQINLELTHKLPMSRVTRVTGDHLNGH